MFRYGLALAVSILVGVPAVPALADEVSLAFDQSDGNPDDDPGKWVRTGDVFRFRVRLTALGEDASLALASSPARALSAVGCAPTARAAGGVRICRLGEVTGERVVDVALLVPDGVRSVVLAAVAQLREDDGVATVRHSATIPVAPSSTYTMTGNATEDTRPGSTAEEPPEDASGALSRGAAATDAALVADTAATLKAATRRQSSRGTPTAGNAFTGFQPAQEHPATLEPRSEPGPIIRPYAVTPPAPRLDPGTPHAVRPDTTAPHRPTRRRGAARAEGAHPAAPRGEKPGALGLQGATGTQAVVPPSAGKPVVGRKSDQVRLPQAARQGSDQLAEEGPGAPLPIDVVVAAARPVSAKTPNLTAGITALPVTAGGIAVLLACLWLVARSQRNRIRRKVS